MTRAAFHKIPAGTPGHRPADPPPRELRFPSVIGAGPAPWKRLDGLRVALVGAGSVGRPAALHLARLHPRTLWIIDRGTYRPESLLTQPVAPQDLGRPKASATAAACKEISPPTEVLAWDGPLEDMDLLAFDGAEAVLMATDNLAVEIEAGRRCLSLGIPLLQAAVHGETLVAQVRIFANRDGAGPCPACGFGLADWAHLNRQTAFSCEAAPGAGPVVQAEPTRSPSYLCSLAADLAVGEIVRGRLGIGPPPGDSVLEYCAVPHRAVRAGLVRNPRCPVDHTPFERRTARRPLAETTLRELACLAGCTADESDRPDAPGGPNAPAAGPLRGVAWRVEGHAFHEAVICRCGRSLALHRFARTGASLGPCPVCGAGTAPSQFFTHEIVPSGVLASLADRPLRDLGAVDPGWIVVRRGDRAVLVQGNGSREPRVEPARHAGAGGNKGA